jgi:hypothetical protein
MLVERIRRFFAEYSKPRYRDRRGFYASGLLSDARDLYWEATKQKATNPTDYVGHLRMLIGKAIETELTNKVLANLHFFGLHMVGAGEQIPIGGSSPAVDGYLDGLFVERQGDNFGKPWVLEIKVKNGYGANLFVKDMNPGDEYLAQLGYYLRDLNSKGVTDRGIFLFILNSDANMGEMVEIECNYDAASDEVRATKATFISGATHSINFSLKLTPVLERLQMIERCVKAGALPPVEKVYKHVLTPDYLASMSDNQLKVALKGEKVHGDWQVSYSKFKNLHVKEQGTVLGYTPQELTLLAEEYKRRVPGAKIGAEFLRAV